MIFIMAGLVIGVVVFALIVNHRKPDESVFIRQFEEATKRSRQESQSAGPMEMASITLKKRDFKGNYIGRTDLSRWPGDLEISGELGEVSIETDLNVDGNLRIGAGSVVRVQGDINVGRSIYVAGSLSSGKTIESNQSIHCGDTIEAEGSIFASGSIGCGRSIRAAGNIMAREGIRSGVEICAGDSIHAGGTIEAPLVTAGRDGDPRTITCSRLLRGKVSRGELVETGDRRGGLTG